jgi:hypothetical protein
VLPDDAIPPIVISRTQNESSLANLVSIQRDAYKSYWDVMASAALSESLSINCDSPLLYKTGVTGVTAKFYKLGRSHGLVSKMPGFYFSAYKQTAEVSSTIISIDKYIALTKQFYESVPNRVSARFFRFANPTRKSYEFDKTPKKQSVYVKLMEGSVRSQRDDVINGIRNYIDSEQVSIFDAQTLIDDTTAALELLNIFFFVGLFAVFRGFVRISFHSQFRFFRLFFAFSCAGSPSQPMCERIHGSLACFERLVSLYASQSFAPFSFFFRD